MPDYTLNNDRMNNFSRNSYKEQAESNFKIARKGLEKLIEAQADFDLINQTCEEIKLLDLTEEQLRYIEVIQKRAKKWKSS